jgi:glycosyltransferase 2 family protein
MKKWLLVLLQALVSGVLLFLILRRPDFQAPAARLWHVPHPGWLICGLGFAAASSLIGAVRWAVFLRIMDINISPWEVLRLSWIGSFCNNFLVGAVGGDAVKTVWLCSKGYRRLPSLVSVLLDRVSGLGALLLCSFGFIFLRWDLLSRSPTVAGVTDFIILYLLGLLALMILSFVTAIPWVAGLLPRWVPWRLQYVTFTGEYFKFVTSWRQSLLGAGLSVGVLLASLLTFYCSARAFGIDISMADFLSFMPAVDVISALPISLGGFGVREQLFVTILGELFAVPAALAFAVSIIGATLNLLWSLGGLALLPSYGYLLQAKSDA